MRYGILGTTTAQHEDGSMVPLPGARLRTLMTALALTPGRVRSASALIEEVWDGDPPADGAAALQALVGRLRRAVGHGAVGSAEGGYRLTAVPDDVDAHRFERLVGEGGRALADGRPSRAAEFLDEALKLWRGPVAADLPGREAVAPRYESLRLEARRLHGCAQVALGRAEQALPELADLAAAHPLNEPVQALRIRALRHAGRSADALAAYEAVRQELADRLGADPGPELKALYAELLNPPPPPATATPGNRRPRLTSFVGREADLGLIRADLAAARLVTVTGTGGTGKTRLSQEVGDLVAGQWPDGVWFAELAPVEDPRTVPEAVLTALGLRETLLHAGTAAEQALTAEKRTQDPGLQLAEYCAGRKLLLVLDNCEHVIGAAAALTEQLLTQCPGMAVLATSREPLGVPGELVRPLDPLPRTPALRLLADRGAAARPGFTPADDPEAAAELCRRLDGLPLAIELAAARLRGLTPRQLADRLDDRFRILTAGSRTVLPRQQTLRAVVDWSWELLTGPERVVLRRLAVFAGGWDLPAAEAVCGDPDPGGRDGAVDPRDVAAALASLVDKSLVLTDFTGDGARYRMLETISEYAAERLDEAAERTAVERRHIRYFREYLRAADPELRGARQLLWLDRLEREHDNLRAALRRAVETGDEQEALVLTMAAGWFWQMRNYRTEMRAWPAAVAAMGPDPFAASSAHLPLDRGPLDAPPPMPPEQLEEARRWIRIAEVTANHIEDRELWSDPAMMELGRAIVAAYPPHLPQSSTRPGLMRMSGLLLSGQFHRIAEIVDGMVEGCRRDGRIWELAFALQIRAKTLNEVEERLESTLADVREARELFGRVGDDWGLAEVLSAEAEAASKAGQWARAAECCREAIGLARKLGAHQQVPGLLVRLGDVIHCAGDVAEGEALIRAGLRDAERFGPAAGGAAHYGQVLLIRVLGERGDLEEAHALIDAMRANPSPVMPSFVSGLLTAVKGWLLGLGGDPEQGLRLHQEAVGTLDDHPLADIIAPRIGIILIPPAVILLARLGTPAADRRAVLLLGAHDRLRPMAIGQPERRSMEESAALLRRRLGPAGYQELYAEGEELTLDEAIALMR